MLKSPRFWIGLLISLICLYFAFQGIQFDKLLDALRSIDVLWIVIASAIFCVSYGGRVLRWQLLFAPQPMRLNKVFHAMNIGYLLSSILPARLGDVVRAVLVGQFENVSKARALSTVVVERLFDGLTVVLFLAVTALFIPNIPDVAQQGAIVVAAAGIGGLAVLLLLSFNKERGLSLLHRLASPIPFLRNPKLWQSLESLIDGFAILRSPRELLGVAGWSVFAWLTGGMMYWAIFRAMGMHALSFDAAFLVMTVASLVVIVPSSPGYIGVFHATVVFTLNTVFSTDKSDALSYAVVMHAFNYLWLILLGIYSMWHEGLSYSRLQSLEVAAESEVS